MFKQNKYLHIKRELKTKKKQFMQIPDNIIVCELFLAVLKQVK